MDCNPLPHHHRIPSCTDFPDPKRHAIADPGGIKRDGGGCGLKPVFGGVTSDGALRRAENLKGKCGFCEFREVCGGSRARAYALTGDPFAEEPCCVWQPKNAEAATAV